MGTWGSGPFENDSALDWVSALRTSRDREFPLGVLRQLGAGLIGGREEEGVAAAETVAASRGWPAEPLPHGVWDWLERTGGLAEASAAELALRVIDVIDSDVSELWSLWDEVGGAEWRERMADLRERLAAPAREVSLPPPPPKVRVRVGDVVQLLTSSGQAAFIQLVGKDDRGLDLIRVLPGMFSVPPWGDGLAALIGGDTAFLSLGLFRGMSSLAGSQHRGNYPIPPPLRGPQPLKSHSSWAEEPSGGPVTYAGERFSAEEFAQRHPDIDQTMLTVQGNVPMPGLLLLMIERDWRPWMNWNDGLVLAEDPARALAIHPWLTIPQRPTPYPSTAQPGKFLLDSDGGQVTA